MATHIAKLADSSGHDHDVQVNAYPPQCPICHTSVFPRFVGGICHANVNDKPQAVFRCTAPRCGKIFIADYSNNGSGILQLGKVEPVYATPTPFPDPVQKVSPSFVEIFNQATAAESHSLHQLTGIGLRKALEFLVKDFSVHLNPKEKERVLSTPLAACIDQFITDDRIKTCAKLAAWLGNDETHYVRKWEDKDISDLKLLIRLTVNWIENHLLTEKYKQEMMPKGNGQQKN